MPEAKKATLKTMLSAELDTVLGRRPDLEVVTVADGAHDNWRYLDALAPDATAVVDFYHAAEQLKSALDARYGENDAKGRAQFHKLRHILLDDCDGVEKVIRALAYQRKQFPRRKRIGEVLRYFPAQPPPHALRRHPSPQSPRRFRCCRGRMQNVGHPTAQALRNALALPRWTGHLDTSCTAAKLAIRSSVGVALQDLSSRCDRPR